MRTQLAARRQSGYVMVLVLLLMSQMSLLSAGLIQTHTDRLIFDASFVDERNENAKLESMLFQCEQRLVRAYLKKQVAHSSDNSVTTFNAFEALLHTSSLEVLFDDIMTIESGCYYIRRAQHDIRSVYESSFQRSCQCDAHAFKTEQVSVVLVAFDGNKRRAIESRFWLSYEHIFKYMTFSSRVSEHDKETFYTRYFKPKRLSYVELRLL